MHMVLLIGGGIVTLGLFLLFGYLWGGSQSLVAFSAKLFILFWLIIALVNMWVGVTMAGYSVRDELPILLVVFAIPALAATFTISYLAR